MSDLFHVIDQSAMTKVLRDFCPAGMAWDKKNDPESVMYRLLKALSVVYTQNQETIKWLSDEGAILTADDLLTDWEESVDLPDECVTSVSALDRRRKAAVYRFRKVPYVNIEQIQDLARFFFPEFSINVRAKADTVPTPTKEDRFTLLIELVLLEGEQFEYTFEHPFQSSVNPADIVCLLRKVVPANVWIETIFVG